MYLHLFCFCFRLNLYRTATTAEMIMIIATECPDLEYINLGSCFYIKDYDRVTTTL